jgi:hypothetical protein
MTEAISWYVAKRGSSANALPPCRIARTIKKPRKNLHTTCKKPDFTINLAQNSFWLRNLKNKFKFAGLLCSNDIEFKPIGEQNDWQPVRKGCQPHLI